jgi:hypothetical protein
VLAIQFLEKNFDIEPVLYSERKIVEKPIGADPRIYVIEPKEKYRIIRETSIVPENWDRQEALDRANLLIKDDVRRFRG